MERAGQCMCGAVKFTVTTGDTFSLCHCKMCQRWASGAFMGVPTTAFAVTEGAACLTEFKSSEWASRAFCSRCGSNIYYMAEDDDGPNIAIGALDDPEGLTLKNHWFVDKKPAAHDATDGATTYTQAQIEKMFGDLA